MIPKTSQGRFSLDLQVHSTVLLDVPLNQTIRDQHGRHRQQYDLYAGLVSTKRRPRIPLVSYSIFEVAVFLRYIYSLMYSQHDGGTPENVVINDKGGRYDSWNLLQVNY